MRKQIYFFTTAIFALVFFSCQVSSQKTYTTNNKKEAKNMNAAVNCYYDKDDKCAIKNCELAIKTDAKFGEPYLLLAGIYKEYNNYAKAEEYLLKAVEIDPKVFAEGYAALGDIYHLQFMFGKAC